MSIRTKFRKIGWLARFYRRFIIKLPLEQKVQMPKKILEQDYEQLINDNDSALSLVPLANSQCCVSFSIITPVYCPNLEHFQAMVESVIKQCYSKWQLILVNDFSQSEALDALLKQYNQHKQITVIQRSSNGNFSRASNDGLTLATGDYITFLNHDDLLHPNALNTVALSLLENPDANILYSDDNQINKQGQFEPSSFKPRWNPDLLYSFSYVRHLDFYKKSLIENIGGFILDIEGCDNYDLLLRAVLHCNAEKIIYIPFVIYYWRLGEGSTITWQVKR